MNVELDLDTHLPFTAYKNMFYIPNCVADANIGSVDKAYYSDSTWGRCATQSVFCGQYDYGNTFHSFRYGLSPYSDTSSEGIGGEGGGQPSFTLERSRGKVMKIKM